MLKVDSVLLVQAVSLLEQALEGKGVIERLPLVDPNGVPVRLQTKGGSCVDFRIEPWKGRGTSGRSRRRVRTVGRLPTAWVLRRASQRDRQALRESGSSFVDLSGLVHLDLDGLIVDRSDLGPVRPVRSGGSLIDPFADRSSLVCRTLLSSSANRPWGVRELAEATGVNPSTASRVVHELALDGVVEFERQGRSSTTRVLDPPALLRRWTRAYDWGRNERLSFHAPIGAPDKFLTRLNRVFPNRRWALTLHAGASLIKPHAPWERVHVYLEGTETEALELTGAAGWRLAEDGNFVVMLPIYKDSVWWRTEERRGLPVVSVLQLVLDLWHYPPRGREQAEQLLETRLQPIWSGDGAEGASTDSVRALLGEVKDGLARIYGDRLKGVYAYGSYARGEEGAESDVDVIVVLDGVDHYAAEVDRTGELISRTSLSYGVSISRIFVSEKEWTSGDSAFLLHAREEAIQL